MIMSSFEVKQKYKVQNASQTGGVWEKDSSAAESARRKNSFFTAHSPIGLAPGPSSSLQSLRRLCGPACPELPLLPGSAESGRNLCFTN